MNEWKLPHTFIFDGRAVRYGVCGDGPAVVVVHGTPGHLFFWVSKSHNMANAPPQFGRV